MEPSKAITQCLKKYATMSGRASRPEFWWFFGFCLVLGLGFGVLLVMANLNHGEGVYLYLLVVAQFTPLLLFSPLVCAARRRQRDVYPLFTPDINFLIFLGGKRPSDFTPSDIFPLMGCMAVAGLALGAPTLWIEVFISSSWDPALTEGPDAVLITLFMIGISLLLFGWPLSFLVKRSQTNAISVDVVVVEPTP